MGSPTVFNVRDYGADPKGSFDSTPAIQEAIADAVKARGGAVFFPAGTYLCEGRLRADESVGVRLVGVGSETPGSEPAATLRYQGRRSPFISARSTLAFGLKGLGIFTDHPGFEGIVIDLSHSTSETDSAFALIEDCVIMGGAGLLNASALISLDRAITSAIRNCNLGNAQTAILGVAQEDHYSNAIQIYGCHLTNTVAAPIANPGSAWIVEGCTFAPLSGGLAGAIECGVPARALSVIGCWMGDVTALRASTWIRFKGGGLQVVGNTIGGNNSTTAIGFVGGASVGIDIRANVFDSHAVGIDMGPGQGGLMIGANFFADVATPVEGTSTPNTTIQSEGGLAVGRQPSTPFGVGGTVHIGAGEPTTSQNAQLGPGGDTPVSFRLAFGADGTGWQYRIARNHPTEGVQDLVAVQDNGNVGLGVMTPSFRLHLDIDSAAKPGTSTWSTPSDTRLKEPGSVSIFGDGLEVARSLRPVRYRYNGRAGLPATEHIGVIAQEALESMPYAVERFRARLDPDDDAATELLAFNPHALQYVLINAVKELDARLQRLEAGHEL